MEPTTAKEKVLPQLDERYSSKEEVAEIVKRFEQRTADAEARAKVAEEKSEANEKAVAEVRAAAILHDEYKDTPKGPKFLVAKALYAQLYRKAVGVFPQGRDDAEARQYKLIASLLPGMQQKALSTGTTTAGGFLIPEEWDAEVIPTLKAESVVFAINPTIRQTNRDVYHWPAFNAKKTFVWSAENAAASEGTPTTREIVLTPRKCIGLSAVSNEWLEDADAATDASLRGELLGELAEFLDASLLHGSGSNRPTGLRNIASVNEISPAAVTLDWPDFARCEAEIRNDNVRGPLAWIMRPQTLRLVKNFEDVDGRPIFPEAVRGEVLRPLGYPVFETTQLPTDEGPSSETVIMLVKPEDVLIAQRRGITVAISEDAGFASDQIQIRLTARFDINLKHVESLCVLSSIQEN